MSDHSLYHHHGTLCLLGEKINKIGRYWSHRYDLNQDEGEARVQRDGTDFHLTVVGSTEMELSATRLEDVLATNTAEIEVIDVGIGNFNQNDEKIWYVCIHCSWVDELRMSLGLPQKDLHITLSFARKDCHSICKSFLTIVEWNDVFSLCPIVESDKIDYDADDLQFQKYSILIQRISSVLMSSTPCSREVVKFLRCAGIRALKRKMVGVAHEIGTFLLRHGFLVGLKLLLSSKTVVDYSFLATTLPLTLNGGSQRSFAQKEILRRFNLQSNTAYSKHTQFLSIESQSNVLNYFPLPRNFSWVTSATSSSKSCGDDDTTPVFVGQIAGSAYPTSTEQLVALYGVGIGLIITVHEEPLPAGLDTVAKSNGMNVFHVSVIDRQPPSVDQMREICELIKSARSDNVGVLVHCQGGVGRTNTIIIAFLMWELGISCAESIETVGSQRKMILAQVQEKFLKTWWRFCLEEKGLDSKKSSVMVQITQSLELNHNEERDNYQRIASVLNLPPLILLCGYAASGKSTFAKALVDSHPKYFCRINKDEMRGKGQCQDVMHNAMRLHKSKGQRKAGSVVVDCCNLTVEKRKEWLDLSHRSRAWCIFFDSPIEKCMERIRVRTNHPTIPPGETGVGILRSMQPHLRPPLLEEGFEKIICLQSFEESTSLLKSWNITRLPAVTNVEQTSVVCFEGESLLKEDANTCDKSESKLLKFPRTPHVANLGAATRDDKILSSRELEMFIGSNAVCIEEKLDGANMGISISSEGVILIQNRSHFISSRYHPQFSPLDRWVAKHSAELYCILEPGRHILYGEWLYATHSVRYTHLPGWFVAYDIFDKQSNTFLSRAAVVQSLSDTSIPVSPLLFEGVIASIDHLKSFVEGPSRFSTEQREGIVIRLCNELTLSQRAKLVRPNFIAGNERWNRSSQLATNVLDFSCEKN